MNKLKVMYLILQQLNLGKEILREHYDVSNEEWVVIAEMLNDEGLAKNIKLTRGGRGNKVLIVWYDQAQITLAGLNFLEENNALS